jgi:TetR/AcrR family tetracycline transcriptional repressor
MKLEKQTIVRTALELLDRAGLEGLTMRKLADALGVQAPALYWHFPNKQALLDDMAEALLNNVPAQLVDRGDAAETLESLAIALRQALLSRRNGARVYAGTFIARPNAMLVGEVASAALLRAGLDGQSAFRGLTSLLYFVLGFVIEEQALAEQSRPEAGQHPMAEKLMPPDIDRYPHVAALWGQLLEPDQDARFRFGVDLIVRSLIEKHGGHCR